MEVDRKPDRASLTASPWSDEGVARHVDAFLAVCSRKPTLLAEYVGRPVSLRSPSRN